jgi:hypothetical protein
MDNASVVIGAVQMHFSNDMTTWSDWVPYAQTSNWTLDSASGDKTVYVEYKDANGKVWPVVKDVITLNK